MRKSDSEAFVLNQEGEEDEKSAVIGTYKFDMKGCG
jgi:hypothetical protein